MAAAATTDAAVIILQLRQSSVRWHAAIAVRESTARRQRKSQSSNGLADAVRPEEAEHLAVPDLEAHVGERDLIAERLAQAVDGLWEVIRMTAPGQPAPARGRALSKAAGMARTALRRPEQQGVAEPGEERKAATASGPLVAAVSTRPGRRRNAGSLCQ